MGCWEEMIVGRKKRKRWRIIRGGGAAGLQRLRRQAQGRSERGEEGETEEGRERGKVKGKEREAERKGERTQEETEGGREKQVGEKERGHHSPPCFLDF